MIRALLACIGFIAVLVWAGVVGLDGQCARLESERRVEVCGPR